MPLFAANPKLRRRWRTAALPLLAFAAVARAQMHHVDKPEQVTRAIGVFEWTGDLAKPTATRLVPVSLYIDGQFQDAGLYLSRPVPFALQTGDIYSVERAGESEGLLSLDGARKLVTGGSSVDADADAIWYGVGQFKPNAAAVRAAALKPSRHLSAISTEGSLGSNSGAAGHPTLNDRSKAPATPATPDTASNDHPSLSRRSSPAPATTDSGDADSSKPTLSRRPAATPSDPSASAPADTKPTATDTDTAKPTLSRRQPPADPKTTDTKDTTGTASSGDADGDKPTLSRRSNPAPAEGDKTTSSTPASSDDGDKPTLSRRPQSTDTTGNDNSKSSSDVDRPTLRKRDPSQDADRKKQKNSGKPQSGVTAAGPQLGDDPDRPTLHRGGAKQEGTPTLEGLPANMQQAVAVSDATHREVHPFALEWEAGQRATVLAGLENIARNRVQLYLNENRLMASATPIPAAPAAPAASPPAASTPDGAPPKLTRGKPTAYQTPKPVATTKTTASKTAAAKKTAAKKPATTAPAAGPLLLQDEQLTGFTLSYGGLPTFVYTARVATGSQAGPGGPVAYVTLVAQQLPSGDLQVSLGSVTDAAHLDRTPWLRLVDAVDADWTQRASLLFELRGEHVRQFALYRLTSAQAEQTFATGPLQ